MGRIRYKVFRLYQQMPEFVGRVIGVVGRSLPKRWVLGSEFMRWDTFLEESQWWDEQKIREYQNEEVQKLIAHAYERVPFYHREMDIRGIKPKDIETTEDLHRLPIVNKQMMLQNPNDFMAKGYDTNNLVKVVSGGTSGSPMHFYWPISAHIIERAFLCRYWKWAGYNLGERAIRIRAKRDVKNIRHYDAVQNVIELYPTVLDEDFAIKLAETARKFRPKAIFGYPSYIYSIVKTVGELGLEKSFDSVRVCFGASEKVFAEQRKAVEDIIGVRLFEWYGMGELIASFGLCEEYRYMHVSPEHSYVKFLRQDGTAAEHGEQAMIVGTSFLNYVWPMINYSIEDVAETTDESCPCGRKFRCVKEVYGRCGDFVLTPSGKLISPTSLEFAVRFLENVLEYQIVQTEIDCLRIMIVPGLNYEDSIAKFFADEILTRIGEPMKISIDVVDKIKRPWSQKNRFIVSEFGKKWFAKGSVQ